MPDFSAIDHLVIAGPHLAELTSKWREATGISPVPGGAHTGRGTRNELVGIDATTYIELIGPDPDQPAPSAPRAFGIDGLGRAELVTFAVAVDDLDAATAAVRGTGIDPGEIMSMERLRPDGVLLSWRLSVPPDPALAGVMPFLIDWGDSPHPAADLMPAITIAAFGLSHPNAAQIKSAVEAATGWSPQIVEGDPKVSATLASETAELSI